jgi:hypothetical protein
MNPWLEGHWGDVHTRLTTYACDQLQPQLPSGLRARIEEYVAVEDDVDDGDSPTYLAPDVRIIERPDAPEDSGGIATAVAVAAEPIIVPRRSEPATLRYLQIVDVKTGHRIVTSIEFLSLANKIGTAGRKQYREKQQQMIEADVNLVEIDLLRAGLWVLAVQRSHAPKSCRGPYRISVVRAERSWQAEVYRVPLRQRLPTIRIPLRRRDDDVTLDIQSLIDAAYVNGRYAHDIDYDEEPVPALSAPDAQWADRVLREQGLRQGAPRDQQS